jgi:hypothetical protein
MQRKQGPDLSFYTHLSHPQPQLPHQLAAKAKKYLSYYKAVVS